MKFGMYILTTLICLIVYVAIIVTIAVYSELIAVLFVIQSFLAYLIHYLLTAEKKHI